MKTGNEDLVAPEKWYEKLPHPSWKRFECMETHHPWFEVYRLPSSIYALYEPGQFEEVISYLVLGKDTAALVDTGNGIGDTRGLVEELTDLPTTVVNTHVHGDHIGMNHAFDDVALFDTPYSREIARRGRSVEEMAHCLCEGMVWKPLPEGFNPSAYHIPPFKVTRWLKDGDQIDLGGRRLNVVHTPGHSPDSISILDGENRLLWTGDSFYNAPLYFHSAHANFHQFIDSCRRMVSLSPHYDWLLPSHNETWAEKGILSRVLNASKEIKEGTGRDHREGVKDGIPIRRYDYEGFSIIVRAPQPQSHATDGGSVRH